MTERSLLTVVEIRFKLMGKGQNAKKSRAVAWLCDECVENDPVYKSEAFSNSPGSKSPGLERVRKLKGGA